MKSISILTSMLLSIIFSSTGFGSTDGYKIKSSVKNPDPIIINIEVPLGTEIVTLLEGETAFHLKYTAPDLSEGVDLRPEYPMIADFEDQPEPGNSFKPSIPLEASFSETL